MLNKTVHLFTAAILAFALSSCGGESKSDASDITENQAVEMAAETIAIEESLKKVEEVGNAIDEELKKLEEEQNQTN